MTIHRLRTIALACLVAVSVSVAFIAAADPGAARQTATFSVSRDTYYAGQGLVFSGSLSRTGKQRVWLEYNMNRPGDSWTVIDHTTHYTDASGRFSFRHPAPAMYNISLRVNSASGPTPGKLFHAVDEMMTVDVAPAGGRWSTLIRDTGYLDFASYPAVAGDPFTVTVDTAPEGGPVLVGRAVQLQERVDASTWRTVGTADVGSDGLVTFRTTADSSGVVVYRARAEEWTAAGSRMGWNSSFPTYVYVHDTSGRGPSPATRTAAVTSTALPDVAPTARLGSPSVSAGQKYGWGEPTFDFGYEWGESLTDAPFRGKKLHGAWRDSSTGSGWVGRHNGSMFFESRYGIVAPRDAGSGDFGTTSATLTGNASAYGRWELRMRSWDLADAGSGYRVRAELVPADPSKRACGARAITIMDLTPAVREVRFGASTPVGDRAWTGKVAGVALQQAPHSFGVEVAADHITWLLDGNPVGTLRDDAAIPGVPLTLRLSLVGDGTAEMRHTYVANDWIRSWDMSRGSRVTGGGALVGGKSSAGC